ncbi:MAG: proline--tRNA ligase [Mycoplasmataceae bacterium]|nr:proline--tRNA ligase [Mycoplasmataceae bacterium]
MKEIKQITPIEKNFSKWYIDVVTNGKLIEYGTVKGTIIFKPNSYGIWENIQVNFNKILKQQNIRNIYLPMLIPANLISKEKNHVDGFAPELATITKVGNKQLSEEIYIRPTSEVLFAEFFKTEINSYNDLPLAYNQWANVLRWEKTTNPFLRNTEFLWQEGHTCHSTQEEAEEMTMNMINVYKIFLRDYLAIPVITGIKTELEKFSGAVSTFTVEAMMKDGKALQSGTSHFLGQNFSKIFNISYKSKENKSEFVYQTSWGISTRLIGAIIMTHGDNRGIIIPPKIAPIQIDIIQIMANKEPKVEELSTRIFDQLKGEYSIRVDKSNKTAGYKAAQSEIEGIPIRIEVGPRDVLTEEVAIIRRDTLEKVMVKINDLTNYISKLIDLIQSNLLQSAEIRLKKNIKVATTYNELKTYLEDNKFVLVPIINNNEYEKKIKEETTATARCIPLELDIPTEGMCIFSGEKTTRFVIYAKSY